MMFISVRPEILLHPPIPKPLHGINPRTIMGEAWWDRQRIEAYARNDFHCMACGVHKLKAKKHHWLEAHEFYKIDYEMGRMEMIEVVALCHYCHNYIHKGRLEVLLDKKQITRRAFDEIIKHGHEILIANNLTPHYYNGPVAEWSKWRLVINEKEYEGKFKNYEEWKRYYHAR